MNCRNGGILNNPKYNPLRDRFFHLGNPGIYSSTKHDKPTVCPPSWGIMRPDLRHFLKFCFIYFKEVNIWTAGNAMYADEVCNSIFSDIGHRPNNIYSYDKCETNGKFGYHKPLSKIMTGNLKYENTFIIDDRYANFLDNLGNGILIPQFSPKTPEDLFKEDHAISQLMAWFMTPEVMKCKDITKLGKVGIFKSKVRRTPDFLA